MGRRVLDGPLEFDGLNGRHFDRWDVFGNRGLCGQLLVAQGKMHWRALSKGYIGTARFLAHFVHFYILPMSLAGILLELAFGLLDSVKFGVRGWGDSRRNRCEGLVSIVFGAVEQSGPPPYTRE